MAISEMASDSSKIIHQRVGDKILRRKFGIRLSSISKNKGAMAPRKLPFGRRLFSKNLLLDLRVFPKKFFRTLYPAILTI